MFLSQSYLSLLGLQIDLLPMPFLMALYLLQSFSRQMQFGLLPVSRLTAVFDPGLRMSIKAKVKSQSHSSGLPERCLKNDILWPMFASGRDRQKDGITLRSYFQEGLVVILVPTSIKTSCPLQETFQGFDFCGEVSVHQFGLI